jgi:hypothetical protein
MGNTLGAFSMMGLPEAIRVTWHDTLPHVALCQMANNVQMSDLERFETTWQHQRPAALVWDCPQGVLLPPRFWSTWAQAALLPALIILVAQDFWTCHLIGHALTQYHPDANIYCVRSLSEATLLLLQLGCQQSAPPSAAD